MVPKEIVPSAEYRDIVLTMLPDGWSVRKSEPWLRVAKNGVELPGQGWKLHVSAISEDAPEVLRRAAEVLFARGCAFTFAATPQNVRKLNSRLTPRGSAGKFLTAYPVTGVLVIAAELDEATAGLRGPRILSDRPVCDGSLVHYRYGSFVPRFHLYDSGSYEPILLDPDGKPVLDRRDAWFSPPPWAPALSNAPVRRKAPEQVLIAGRYTVRSAIRHSNKGGVFRATDAETGTEVAVKQGRAHVGELPGGGDVRDLLRNEARILRALDETGLAPGFVDLVDSAEHTFLVRGCVAISPGPTRFRGCDGVFSHATKAVGQRRRSSP